MTLTTTRVMIRNSERSDFTQCRQKWHWAYVDRFRTPETSVGALMLGDIIHRSLAGWYIPETNRKKVVRGVHPARTADQIFQQLDVLRPELRGQETDDQHHLAVGMMEKYVEYWGNDDNIFVVHPEMPFQYDVYNDAREYICTLVGTTDGLIRKRSTWELGLQEHKTAALINTDHLGLDEQANTYWTIVPMWLRHNGIIGPDEDVTFMEYNFMLKKIIEDDRPRNKDGYYLNSPKVSALKEALALAEAAFPKSAKKDDLIAACEHHGIDWQQLGEISATQTPDLFHRERVFRNEVQRRKTFNRIVAQAREMKMVRRGKMDLYKSPSKSCVWCQFKDMCEMDEYTDDLEEYQTHGLTRWNPYTEHIWALKLPV